jgi:hypothetical protein
MSIIEFQGNARVTGGLAIPVLSKQELEAVELIDVVIKKGAAKEDVLIAPPDSVVQFLLIKASPSGKGLSYSVNAEEPDATKRFPVDAFQLLIGGAVKLLHDAPQKLFFYNTLSENATLQILVGKTATTP